jgi:hypothetical protein
MNTKDFVRLGVPLDRATRRATDLVARHILGDADKSRLAQEVTAIVANPLAFADDRLRRGFIKALLNALLNAPPPPSGEPLED